MSMNDSFESLDECAADLRGGNRVYGPGLIEIEGSFQPLKVVDGKTVMALAPGTSALFKAGDSFYNPEIVSIPETPDKDDDEVEFLFQVDAPDGGEKVETKVSVKKEVLSSTKAAAKTPAPKKHATKKAAVKTPVNTPVAKTPAVKTPEKPAAAAKKAAAKKKPGVSKMSQSTDTKTVKELLADAKAEKSLPSRAELALGVAASIGELNEKSKAADGKRKSTRSRKPVKKGD